MIRKCSGTQCRNEFQDSKYNGQRVCNELKNGGYRCSVCQTVVAKPNSDGKKK